MERKINEVFTDSSGERIICVKAIYKDSCEGCIYNITPQGCVDMDVRGQCNDTFRSDNEDVIFKRADNYLE